MIFLDTDLFLMGEEFNANINGGEFRVRVSMNVALLLFQAKQQVQKES